MAASNSSFCIISIQIDFLKSFVSIHNLSLSKHTVISYVKVIDQGIPTHNATLASVSLPNSIFRDKFPTTKRLICRTFGRKKMCSTYTLLGYGVDSHFSENKKKSFTGDSYILVREDGHLALFPIFFHFQRQVQSH